MESHKKSQMYYSVSLVKESQDLISSESWEEVKDVFFMLKLPIDVEIDDERKGRMILYSK